MKVLLHDLRNGRHFALVNSVGMNAVKALPSVVNEADSTGDLLRRSLLYREFQAEYEEILRHKWFESEKAGHDIGFDLAQVDWRIKHGSIWRKEWREKHRWSTFEI
jgi:uncharacterized protein DUF4032